MEWLNYHHLLYFHAVAKSGSVVAASEALELTQPTLSSQIARLEKRLGEKLFRRVGRRLELTDTGRIVFNYAEEIFSLGQEMLQTLKGHPQNRPMRVVIGVADILPKIIVHRLLEPIFSMNEPTQVVCPEGKPEELLHQLVNYEIDLILTDAPIHSATRLKVFNHQLGECGVTVLGAPDLAEKYQAGFPSSIVDAPWLLPFPNTSLRRTLDQWFEREDIRPIIRGEFMDSALMKVVGRSGEGLFAMPSVIAQDVVEQLGVRVIGQIDSIRERFYAVSAERKIKHPAVKIMTETARTELFGS